MLRQNTVLPCTSFLGLNPDVPPTPIIDFALILANVGMLSVSSGKTIIDVNATAGAVPYFDDEQLVYIARGIATVRSQAVFINPGFKYAASVYKGGSGSSFLVRPFPDQTFLDPPSPMVSQSQQYQYLGIAVLALHLVLGAGACYRWRRNRRRRIRLELPINMSSTSLHDEWIPSIRDQWASLHDDDVALSQVQQSLRTKHRNRRHSSVWMMSAEEMKSYEEIFRAWDIQKSGFLGYEFAMEAFRISGLAQEDLVRIWFVFPFLLLFAPSCFRSNLRL
ncbi:hypothetical protein C8J56DRAFT_366523 [Mycena floridula]|nr:hypothetical protein C8J56DRAFT_366523 [Mycena floridula]